MSGIEKKIKKKKVIPTDWLYYLTGQMHCKYCVNAVDGYHRTESEILLGDSDEW